MYVPEGITIEDGYCLQLLKTIYGLSSSPIRWKELIVDQVLVGEYGLTKVANEDCLLHGEDIYVLIYVDDIKLTGTTDAINKLVAFLQERFKVTKESNNTYLGINLTPTSEGLCMHQEPAINKIIAEYGMADSKARQTPLPHNNALPILETKQETQGYRQLVGKLMYLLATRPDLSFAMKELSRFNDANSEVHWNAAKSTLGYLRAYAAQGLLLKPLSENRITAYVDASYAEELDTRKSTTGKIVFWGDNVISYKSKTQPIVTQSSFEAELMAISSVAQDILWLRNVLEELGYEQTKPSIVYTDSQSVIKWITRGKSSSRQRSKHIDVRALKIIELVESKVVELRYIPTEDNIADAFTKSLGRNKFHFHMNKVMYRFQG
jgi:ribonuclease HI